MKGGMQDRRDVGKGEFGTGGMQEKRNAGQEECRKKECRT